MSHWVNDDGLRVNFGGHFADVEARDNVSSAVRTAGNRHEIVLDFDLQLIADGDTSYTTDRDNDGTKDGFTTGDVAIPAGASIESAKVVMSEQAAGGTSITVGTFELDGSAIDADGLVNATNGAVANLTVGSIVAGGGADIGELSSASLPSYIAITTSGTFTAGQGRVVITYIDAP